MDLPLTIDSEILVPQAMIDVCRCHSYGNSPSEEKQMELSSPNTEDVETERTDVLARVGSWDIQDER